MIFRTVFTAIIGVAMSLAASLAPAATFGPLVTVAELSERLDETSPILLDIRGDAYAAGHIEGAVPAPYGLFRGPAENPGAVPEVAALEERFEALGLELERPIVIVPAGKNDTDFGAAARVFWTLKSTGFTDLSILNGGFEAWSAASLPVDKTPVTPTPSDLELSFSDDWTAETDQVVAATRGEIDALLLDARPEAFYKGESSHPAAAKPGTLPGAKNLDYTSFFAEGSPAIGSEADSSSLMKTLGIDEGDEVVSFCNTGHWAATNWFALSEVAGLENVKLYPGSMVEYSNTGLEMENSPGLLKNFINKATGK